MTNLHALLDAGAGFLDAYDAHEAAPTDYTAEVFHEALDAYRREHKKTRYLMREATRRGQARARAKVEG